MKTNSSIDPERALEAIGRISIITARAIKNLDYEKRYEQSQEYQEAMRETMSYYGVVTKRRDGSIRYERAEVTTLRMAKAMTQAIAHAENETGTTPEYAKLFLLTAEGFLFAPVYMDMPYSRHT